MEILYVEPFFGGSHRHWAERLQNHSRHRFRALTLEGRFWKWRFRGGAVLLAERYWDQDEAPDLILASSMLDLPTFVGFIAKKGKKVPPIAVYCHENQFLYPVPDDSKTYKEQRDHFGAVNWRSALLADTSIYNSAYHRTEAIKAYKEFVRRAPDHRDEASFLHKLEESTVVVPPTPDLQELDPEKGSDQGERPALLWNHRWEQEKGPEEFQYMVRTLFQEGEDMDLILAGPSGNSERVRQELAAAYPERTLLAQEIEDLASYRYWLSRADISLVTSHQDFFGISVVEAMYLRTVPVLPDRLAYPEHLPQELRAQLLYRDLEEALGITRSLLHEELSDRKEQVRASAATYDVRNWVEHFDMLLDRVAQAR